LGVAFLCEYPAAGQFRGNVPLAVAGGLQFPHQPDRLLLVGNRQKGGAVVSQAVAKSNFAASLAVADFVL